MSSGPLTDASLNAPTSLNLNYAGDPIDLASGAFTVATTDLAVGQAEPRGIQFTRYYNSGRVNQDAAKPGFGWTHNYDCRVTETSDAEAGLGLTTPFSMATMIVATRAALLVYDTTIDPVDTVPSAGEWLTVALIAKWGVDQLSTNALNVTLGNSSIQFIKQPGSDFYGTNFYTAGAGITHALRKDGSGNYQLTERNGRTFQFTNNLLLAVSLRAKPARDLRVKTTHL